MESAKLIADNTVVAGTSFSGAWGPFRIVLFELMSKPTEFSFGDFIANLLFITGENSSSADSFDLDAKTFRIAGNEIE